MEHINMQFLFNLEREGKGSVIDFCIKMGFIASSYECPECKSPMKLSCNKDRGQDGFVWHCEIQHGYNLRRSVRSGSWFQVSRLSLITMLKLAYLWVKRTSYDWITDELQLSKNTVGDWMAFFRSVCVKAIEKEGIFMGGPDEIVEIDAKCFSVMQNKQACETWVFAGIERSTKKCFLEIIHNGEEEEIINIVQKYVLPGTTIISDKWKGFDSLESNGYLHQTVSKAYGHKDPVTGAHKNTVLSLWSKVKKIISKRIGIDQFRAHLAEVMWRSLHQKGIREQIASFFKTLSHIFAPRVRDDPSYISKRIEMEKKDDINSVSNIELSENEFIGETQSKEVNTDNLEGEAQAEEVNKDNCEEENESDINSSESELFEEIEVPVVYSKDSLSEDEFEGENGSQNKRQRTMESLDT